MELGLYEVAYLCGGPRRVALTAVVTLRQDRRIKISPARHRIEVTRDEASHPVERAVLDAAPWPGMGLRLVLDEVAGSAAAHSAGDELRRRGLLGKHSHLTSSGRKLRDELQGKVPEGLRIAVLGTCGVDSELRKVLEAPDPPPGSALMPKRRDKREHIHGETPLGTDIAGYPGVARPLVSQRSHSAARHRKDQAIAAQRSPSPGRAVIVGNSDGIGYALTRRLLEDGWMVAGLSRSRSDLRHERYRHAVADVTSAGYPLVLAAELDALGGADLCVYSAGVGEFADVTDLSSQTRALEVNLIGAARTLEVVVPLMVAAGAGHIIGLSSLADAAVSGPAPGYAASKAGLTSYLRGLSLALDPHGVSVTTVRLGFVDTKMAKGDRRPVMMPVSEATDILIAAIAGRPVVTSRPRRMALAIRLLAAATAIRQWRKRPPRIPRPGNR